MSEESDINIFRALDFRVIKASNGDEYLVDADDYDELSRWSWCTHTDGSATRRRTNDGKRWLERMHREIMGLLPGDKRVVDHVNGVRTDNRKSNLRICSQAQNVLNCRVRKHSRTGLKGVADSKWGWIAYIRHNGKKRHLGIFPTPDDAYEFVSLAREMIHGEFANHG